MKVTLLPSTIGGGSEHQYLSSCLINDTFAIDAGCLGFWGSPQDQARVRHVVLSHTHMDHLASLPIFVENAYEGKAECVTVHGSRAVLDCCQEHLFNEKVWPDFIALSQGDRPFLRPGAIRGRGDDRNRRPPRHGRRDQSRRTHRRLPDRRRALRDRLHLGHRADGRDLAAGQRAAEPEGGVRGDDVPRRTRLAGRPVEAPHPREPGPRGVQADPADAADHHPSQGTLQGTGHRRASTPLGLAGLEIGQSGDLHVLNTTFSCFRVRRFARYGCTGAALREKHAVPAARGRQRRNAA